IGVDGHPRIERGYLRKEDVTAKADAGDEDGSAETGAEAEESKKPAGLSDRLVTELSAARTSALPAEIGGQPAAALTALTPALVLQLFSRTSRASGLAVSAREASLAALAESPSEQTVAARHAAWEKQLPEDTAALWPFIAALLEEEQLELLAH